MPSLFASLLSAHILLGLIGVFLSFTVTFQLMRQELKKRVVEFSALWASIAYFLSWFTGGWYYWKYYGATVKPVILAGDYAWAHLVFMEVKEHIFIYLPLASFALALLMHFSYDAIAGNPDNRRSAVQLSLWITIVSIIVTLSGVLISGGAK